MILDYAKLIIILTICYVGWILTPVGMN
jgi:hypothetical protein